MNNVYILGISESHSATAALLKNGQLIACASEERFTRKKQQAGIPRNAIYYCLKIAKIKPKDLTFVACSDLTPPIFDNLSPVVKKNSFLLEQLFTIQEKIERLFPPARKFIFNFYKFAVGLNTPKKHKLRLKKLQKILGASTQFVFYPHHLCHASTAIFSSSFPQEKKAALVFTADGVGDFESATIYKYVPGHLQKLVSIDSQQSLGFFYQHITEYLGLKPNLDEVKVMNLAQQVSAGKAGSTYDTLSPFFKIEKSKNRWRLIISEYLLSRKLSQLLKSHSSSQIAAAAQKILEETLTSWILNATRHYRIANIACSGGVFANTRANQKIASLASVKSSYFAPSPGDQSNALGAAYWCYFEKTGNIPQSSLLNPKK